MKRTASATVAALLAAASLPGWAQNDLEKKQLEQRIQQLEEKVDALAATQVHPTTAPATSIGGYGELHYNNIEGKSPTFDFHRFVLFFNHTFSENLKLYSELELEHAISGDGQKGEVELEQAYLDWTLNDRVSLQGGVMLQPIGFLNETHEPDTFYGVERPIVEKDIIPTTWWGAGVGMKVRNSGTGQWQLMVTEGLYDPSGTQIRKARQKSAKTRSESLGYTLAYRVSPAPGVNLGVSLFYQNDITQGDRSKTNEAVSATLGEVHGQFEFGNATLKALYAQWRLSGTAARQANRDEQTGYYLEPSYKLTEKLGAFARYSNWYTDADDKKDRWDVGVNYWLHPRAVLKADYQSQKDNSGFNLGIGYSF
ncbi:Phosphate-selective porin O and P [Sulfurivirga caldicuralii]|uniref:Phosphate-selective porin O and P n=1 Tax=Sulfurivirga caldicuralii TaxID=364032 RepID=A0A1N6GRQ6_9GAMM|nr:porin [Sulfurivirga caldicuralii]SIO10208.1 Phosphate-selective porin O and P [Sulfurivirga caldicuralii]